MCNLHTFFDACPIQIACDNILIRRLRYFKESNSRSPLQLHLIPFMCTTITTPMYKCTWLSIYPQTDIMLKNGYVYRLYPQVTTTKNNATDYAIHPQACITANKGPDYALNYQVTITKKKRICTRNFDQILTTEKNGLICVIFPQVGALEKNKSDHAICNQDYIIVKNGCYFVFNVQVYIFRSDCVLYDQVETTEKKQT